MNENTKLKTGRTCERVDNLKKTKINNCPNIYIKKKKHSKNRKYKKEINAQSTKQKTFKIV